MTDQNEVFSFVIAGVKFSISGLPQHSAFDPVYQPFLNDTGNCDTTCCLQVLGDDKSLAENINPEAPRWTFELQPDGACQICRYTEDGQKLWQIYGSQDFQQVTLAWHPELFPAKYNNIVRVFSDSLGFLLLGMRLRNHGGIMLHGASAELDGCGIICSGLSGCGKSTISRLLHAAGATVLSDERSVIRQETATTFAVHGTPWPSSAGFAANKKAPLKRVYFLTHGTTDSLTPLSAAEAVRYLIPVSMIPWQAPELLDPFLRTIDAIFANVPCALLKFRPTPDVVTMLRSDL